MSHLIATNMRSKRTYRCDTVTLCAGERDVAYLRNVAERLNKHNVGSNAWVFGVSVKGEDHSFSQAAATAAMNADSIARALNVPEVEF